MGWLILLPVGILCMICEKALNFSISGSDSRRPLGIWACLLCGGAMIAIGYWLTFVGWTETGYLNGQYGIIKNTYPIAGWISMLCGGVYVISGPFRVSEGKTGGKTPTISNTAETEINPAPKKQIPEIQPVVNIPEPVIQTEPVEQSESETVKEETPEIISVRCPICKSDTTLRTAKKGKDVGKQFYVCVNYPECKGRIQVRKRAL